jgi:hypothetical protein
MFPGGSRFAFPLTACVVGVALIAANPGASAQQPKPAPHPAGPIARPAAPAFHPAPAPMARPAAPPVMARPAAPAFHPAAAPPRAAMAPHPMPHFAAPARQAPHFAARPSVQHPIPPRPAATAAGPAPRQAFAAQRASAREQRILERQQVAQQRQRNTLSRQSTERQTRIDRLQQHVTQLQTQAPQGRRAQRELAAQQHLLQREQLAQQRDQARQQKLGAPPTATAAAQPNAKATAAQAAARGRFAARFRDNADPRAQLALAARLNGWAPRQAWRHHARAAFVPWLGPVFWPYAYADIFNYTFWPQAYDDAYWAYAYDDFLDTVFWDVGSPYSAYASIAPEGPLEPGSAMVGSSQLRQRSGLSPRALRQLCSKPEQGITAWPFAEITRALRPSAEQRALLDQLKKVAAQAADALKSSCSDDYALTPPGRLRAMVNRISATLEAVRMVRPALQAFYDALSDEQKARFNALAPQLASTPDDRTPQDQPQANAKPENCGAPKSSLTELPIERIDAVLHPTPAQKPALDRLSAATGKAVQTLQAACPDEVPVTPVGRLQAMEQRLSALLQAANQVQPALDDFYASLTSDQKQRFNTLQQVAGQ